MDADTEIRLEECRRIVAHDLHESGSLYLPGCNRRIAVCRPTGLLLFRRNLLPATLLTAIVEKQEIKYGVHYRELPLYPQANPQEPVERAFQLLDDELLTDCRVADFTHDLDRWILWQLAQGRLESTLPEEWTWFALDRLETLAQTLTEPVSRTLGPFFREPDPETTVTGKCLDLAHECWRNLHLDLLEQADLTEGEMSGLMM